MPLSRLTVPFPAGLNPHTGMLASSLRAWARRCGIPPAAVGRAARYDLLAGRMYPRARPAVLARIAETVVWLFLYDDYCDPGGPAGTPSRATRAAARVGHVLSGRARPPRERVLRCLGDLTERWLPLVDDEWRLRWAESVQGFADGIRDEAAARAAGVSPGLPDYLAARLHTSGWMTLTDLVTPAEDASLPGDLYRSTEYLALRRTAGEIACAINDVFSQGKEVAAGEVHNMVLIRGRDLNGDLRAATETTLDWIAGRLTDYQSTRAAFLTRSRRTTAAERHLSGIESLIRGSLDWSFETSRYRSSIT
ncbi:terpene synthase family protein [Nonomuraea sp. NPDC002799]